MAHPMQTCSAATAAHHFRSLQQFFRWAEEEDIVQSSPMAKMRPPRIPEKLIPVLGEIQFKALLATTDWRDFEHRRDQAMLRVQPHPLAQLARLPLPGTGGRGRSTTAQGRNANSASGMNTAGQ